MWAPSLLALAVLPSLVSAGLFPKGSLVKQIDSKAFKSLMKTNDTTFVAFVAPWCGHCQRMVPEYEKAAKGLSPLVPMYAVDCDAEKNKMLCAEQGVKGFPTVKLFTRGGRLPPVDYPGERTSKAFFSFADSKVPDVVSPLKGPLSIPSWLTKDTKRPHLLLLTAPGKNKKAPLLWRVLANSHRGAAFAHVPEVKETLGKLLGDMFAQVQGDKSTVLVWGVGDEKPRLYDGELKLAPLRKFLKDVVLADNKDDAKKSKKEPKAEAKDEL